MKETWPPQDQDDHFFTYFCCGSKTGFLQTLQYNQIFCFVSFNFTCEQIPCLNKDVIVTFFPHIFEMPFPAASYDHLQFPKNVMFATFEQKNRP